MGKEMRAVLAEQLLEAMKSNPDIAVLDADLAKANGTIGLREAFPERAFDVGIAEQNMASIAAGMASYGFIPFIGSFTAFATRRICDQIAISICYARQNVKIIGSDPGIAAELNGGTHMSVEDIGVLRSIPSIVIFEPADAVQLAQAVPQIIAHPGPVYIRLFRKEAPPIFDPASYRFDLMKADVVQSGRDVTLLASGIMLAEAMEAARLLAAQGVGAEVINVHTIKPLDERTVLSSARKTGAVVTCENHNVTGGLGSAAAELLCGQAPMPLERVGVEDHFGEVAKLDYLKRAYHMTAADIVRAAKRAMERKGSS
ncbi:MAG: transketolase C-terminal domain-containing protein [Eubacteriales bacterium]|nr:transketolase C-terminal domain-containing protein [Eubacteriales bacterium]